MKITEFNSLWYSAFGWKLDEKGGADEWAAFVDNPKSNNGAIREVLHTFSGAYADAKEKGKSNYKDIIPTVDEFKRRYFAMLPELKRKWDAERGGMKLDGHCLVCGGGGKVWALAPCIGDLDREYAPEDWRTITRERMYYGVECYPCPICYEGSYHGNHTLRNRVLENSVPEIVPAKHKDNHYGYACGGDYLILNALRDRFGATGEESTNSDNTAKLNGKGLLARVEDLPGKSTVDDLSAEEWRVNRELEDAFPMDNAPTMTREA